MAASTTTTIRGVSIFSRQPKDGADVFEIALSPEGIVIRRPGRTEQHMAWERIAQWDLEEGPDCVVLTLHGGGSVTPLMVKGWNLEDLETVMRNATGDTAGAGGGDAPVPVAAGPAQPRAARRQASQRPRRSAWKALVTVVLLGVVATAVVVVLLQSAGVISWSFLGPVA